ncbi:Ankyrin repeat-containing protein [Apiospora sp. TS-2023a]
MHALVTQLLAEGHDPTKSNFLFPSATQVAAEYNNKVLLRILLEAREATSGLRSLEPGSQNLEPGAIFGAAVAGHIDLLKLVLRPSPGPGSSSEERGEGDRSFGNYTFHHGHPHPHSAVTSDICTPHRWRTRLIMHAMRATESPAVYEYLAAAWAPAHGLSDNYEELASHAGRGNLAMVRWLLDTKGIHPNGPAAEEPWHSALGEACLWGHADMVELLLERGADVDMPRHHGVWRSPLRQALLKNHTGIVRTLLERGAKVEGSYGDNLVRLAFRKENAELVRLLMERGASLDRVAPWVASRLVASGYESMLDLLQSYGFRPEFDEKGEPIRY